MEGIQVPDQVAIQVDMQEVQIHLRWDEYDIAIPVTVASMLADATRRLVEEIGGPSTPELRRETQDT